MPRDAGQFDTQLRRRICTKTANATNGDREQDFTDGNYLWCKVEYTGSTVRDDFGSEQTTVTATIYVHNSPTLTTQDRLRDEDGKDWRIDSLYPGDDEIICDCYQYDGDA